MKMDEFSLRIQNLCEKHDYDYNKLSRELGFSDNTFGHYARGERTPDIFTLVKIADIFQVSLDYLIRGTEPNGESLRSLQPIFKRAGITDPSIFKIEIWQALSPESIKQINHHFNFTVNQDLKKE
ncbi:helix-turn-helix transcriptional regulator [Caldifermentibacillus hisashii]|uniref:helix-turn-helix domain-containing protein n=1 Tax=Caldifermentibacillus hisashii TaxID=996558 RepID=UPI002DF91310|nr:helix-turn-helix transcriptional regulator [Caldifermentibacillus hisashii]